MLSNIDIYIHDMASGVHLPGLIKSNKIKSPNQITEYRSVMLGTCKGIAAVDSMWCTEQLEVQGKQCKGRKG